MKKNLLFFFGILFSGNLFSQTAGSLSFTFTTPKHTSGCYVTSDCRYVLAAWIESGNGTATGTFIKTKLRYVGGGTDDHLPTWGTAAGCTDPLAVTAGGCNVTDATTGATQTTYPSRTITWDGKNVSGTSNGTTVADGAYQVVIQETWGHNATTGTATRRFGFTKGTAIDSQTPTADTNFTGISLKWTPTALATSEVAGKNSVKVFPNPTTNSFKLQGIDNVKEVRVYDVSGKLVRNLPNNDSFDISGLQPGTYFVEANANGKTYYQKVIKK